MYLYVVKCRQFRLKKVNGYLSTYSVREPNRFRLSIKFYTNPLKSVILSGASCIGLPQPVFHGSNYWNIIMKEIVLIMISAFYIFSIHYRFISCILIIIGYGNLYCFSFTLRYVIPFLDMIRLILILHERRNESISS